MHDAAILINDETRELEFSLPDYGRIIRAFLGRGYQIVPLLQARSNQPHLVLRHDVDFDLEMAVEMAEFEASQEYSATYFVLTTSEFYNVFSRSGRRALGRITELKHDVQLHFDMSSYPAGTNFGDVANMECDTLERAIERPVGVVTLHRPNKVKMGHNFTIPGRINENHHRELYDIGFRSDSRGSWRFGHPLGHENVSRGQALQLLTHPIWWVSENHKVPQITLERFLRNRCVFLDQEIGNNSLVYTRKEKY